MKQWESYIKDTGDVLEKPKEVEEIPKGTFLVTADMVVLYPSIPHDEDLKVLRNQYDGTIIFLNLIVNFIRKYQAQFLRLNLRRRLFAFSWTVLKRSS